MIVPKAHTEKKVEKVANIMNNVFHMVVGVVHVNIAKKELLMDHLALVIIIVHLVIAVSHIGCLVIFIIVLKIK